ncbi:MAG: DUF4097 family beta strand repeat-containing protein [Terriglobales bacterium]
MNRSKLISVMAAAAAAGMLAGALAAPAGAQDNRVVVPLSHPSQPDTVRVTTLNSSIAIHAYNGTQVIIETTGGSHHARPVPPGAQGMHRLDSSPGLNATEDNNVVTVSTSIFDGSPNLVIQVPVRTSLRVSTVNGDSIEIDGVSGDISAEDTNGNIQLRNVSGSVVASALNGNIHALVTHLDESKPSSFSSMNGTINVSLPAGTRANLRLKTAHGDIYMDNGFQFQETRSPSPEGERASNGRFRIRLDRAIYGTLNGGGPDIRVQNFNGNIYIHKGQ